MASEELSTGPTRGEAKGLEALLNYLGECGVECTVVPHAQTFTARGEAGEAAFDPGCAAKTVVLVGDDGFTFAVVPASERVDMRKVRDLLGSGRHHLRMATEAELADGFAHYEVGAIPPVGPDIAPEIMDERLTRHERVLCSGGDHRHAVLIDMKDLMALARPLVADICETLA